ncbi:MAG: hypothetical protein ABI885_11550 [Gammaproteobacteria bacterium]
MGSRSEQETLSAREVVGRREKYVAKPSEPGVVDAAICGESRSEIGALLIPARETVERLVENGRSLSDVELYRRPEILEQLEDLLKDLAGKATGSSNRIARAIIIDTPPQIADGEVTEKGTLNQNILLSNRASSVEALYRGDPPVILARK